jgi:hypothetical protein
MVLRLSGKSGAASHKHGLIADAQQHTIPKQY